MSKKIFLNVILLQISFASISQVKTSNKKVYLRDSLLTVKFLNQLNLCEKIDYAEKNIADIIKSRGFSELILLSISNDAKTTIQIYCINGNMIEPDERLILDLKGQLNKIKTLQKCK